MYSPDDYQQTFDPEAYFEHFFSKNSIEDGTRISLFCLPVFAHIIKTSLPAEERQSMLDIGAGPTVYSAICFRDTVQRVYLTDYVSKNLDVLKDWTVDISKLDWRPTINVIMRSEGTSGFFKADIDRVEKEARVAVRAGGVLFSNVHEHPTVPDLAGKQVTVDILVSVFCLESACKTYDEYRKSLKNMLNHLRCGGKFILGSVLDDDSYNAGNKVMFTLLRLSETQILNALEEAGLDVESRKNYTLEEEGVMFIMISKL